MAGVTQTIPNYVGGISEQADQLKFPGQVKDVVNAIPDVTVGLYKRPGSSRIGKLPNVQSGGTFFHYYRDDTEGSYIGQIAANGQVRIWKASGNNAGAEMTVAYGTGGQSALTTYLTATSTEDIKWLNLNDTTFITNRTKTVATTGTTDTAPHAHYAYIELLRSENGRQYGLNVYDNDTTSTLTHATRCKIQSNTQATGDGTGHCPGIGTQVFNVTQGSKKNLIFRLQILGQQGSGNQDDEVTDAQGFQCTYSNRLTLLHGGENWAQGDDETVTLDQAQTSYNYTIRVEKIETTKVKANIKAVRPEPTPFDAETAVTTDTILGGIMSELGQNAGQNKVQATSSDITAEVIGNGIYLSCANDFNVEVVDKDLMRVIQNDTNDVATLPNQCKHGYIVKIANSKMSDEDDYYLKFVGQNNQNGPGSWVECPAPGIVKSFDAGTMPVVIQRTSIANAGTASEVATFTVKQFTYADRGVGDDTTNPIPSFVGNTINKVLFFRSRLVFLSGAGIITARPGTVDNPNFWSESALAVGNKDPIDIQCSSTLPSDLYEGIEWPGGLLCFSTNQQFLLSSDDTIFNPDTAKLRSISTYNYNINVEPISLGTSIGYIDNSGKYSRFNEMAIVSRERDAQVQETSKLIPTTLPKNIDLITNSPENQLVLLGVRDTKTIYGYKYFGGSQGREQSAWFKWSFNTKVHYQFIIDDEYYFLDEDNFLQKLSILQKDADISIDQDSVNYLIHLDNYTTVANGVYDAATKKTTFTNQSDWIDEVTGASGTLVVVDTNSNATRVGRYAECTVINSDDFTVPGDWSSATVYIGYLYEYNVKFPRLYIQRPQGNRLSSDVNASLVIHRVKLNLGKIGLYATTLDRVGKDSYTEIYESTDLDEYEASDAPYLEEKIKTIPVYEKNSNVDITLKSSHPAPATLYSMSWEGDYTNRFYQRV
tara:strand:- start:3842 stop:6652 length:2811 start_codon:yes stop_codon:yes gene_type:complete